jgi:cytochrome c peroxidase
MVLLVSCGDSSNETVDNTPPVPAIEVTKTEILGRSIYFDSNLSEPRGLSCASCHEPDAGFASPVHSIPVSQGIHIDRFGNRNAPTAAYASYIPEFHYDENISTYVGGLFLDGSAKNLEEQAKGPFLNPLEMALPDAQSVVDRVKNSEYATLFKEVYGENIFDDTEIAFDKISQAVAVYGSTGALNRFDSKYDYFLIGEADLKPNERRGLELFQNKARCITCHTMNNKVDGNNSLFTNFTYDNIGVPANPNNPFYTIDPAFNPDGTSYIDLGLGANIGKPEENGKFRVPTLRNIAVSSPYMHNGVFETLEDVLNFYNSIGTGNEPTPEVSENINHSELSNLNLSSLEIADIVAFLGTLTDRYKNSGKEGKK